MDITSTKLPQLIIINNNILVILEDSVFVSATDAHIYYSDRERRKLFLGIGLQRHACIIMYIIRHRMVNRVKCCSV